MSVSDIDEVLSRAVEAGDVPNVVAVAADRESVIYSGAFGPRTVGEGAPISSASQMSIASMTKIVCTVAALQQMERGNLEIDAPVDAYLPEFAHVAVLVGFERETPQLRPAKTRATVRQLITHTAGFGYRLFNSHVKRWEQITGTPHGASGSKRIFTAPMVSDPGMRFEYGISSDWLGRVVENVSGQSLDVYLALNIFAPLSMSNTTFSMTAEQRAESAPAHVRTEDGKWVSIGVGNGQTPEYFSAGAGLYSTPLDYLSFQRMLLGGGTLGSATLLQNATVGSIFVNQIGPLDFPAKIPSFEPRAVSDMNFGPDLKWGLGLLLNTQRRPGMRAAWSGGWSGVQNTHFWVDPASGITGAIYTQCMPLMEPGALRTYVSFEQALYALLSHC